MYPTKCLVCRKKVEVYDEIIEGDDSTGTHPCIAGGHITIFCGYGSKFDHLAEAGMTTHIIRQAVICDACIEKNMDISGQTMRRILIDKQVNVKWKMIRYSHDPKGD